jgi:hypothetical protein
VKLVPIASLALVLALSGCASSPSVEEQIKLIKYEKCLEFAVARWEAYQSNFRQHTGYSYALSRLEEATFADRVFECESYRLP